MAIAHRTQVHSVLSLEVALAKKLLHDALCPLAVNVQRLGRITQVGAVYQVLQNLQTTQTQLNHS